MALEEHLNILRNGASEWNAWRIANPRTRPILRNCDFETIFPRTHLYDLPEFSGFDFSHADLHRISARNSVFLGCNFKGASINSSDLCFSLFADCDFKRAGMRVSKLGSASFNDCLFDGADLSYCTAQGTDFSGSSFVGSTLNHARFVRTNFSRTKFTGTSVYGISAWDLRLDGSKQRDLIVTESGSKIEVDNVEVAQLLHLLSRSSRVRTVIDTLSSKVVLILGRFTPERKKILNRLRTLVRKKGLIPVLFDFKGPSNRNVTETVSTLAHFARFVIADLTDPRSVPHELASVVPVLPSVQFQPIIARGAETYAMFDDLKKYPWVLPVVEYDYATLSDIVDAAVRKSETNLKS